MKWFDAQIGIENTGILNGKGYTPSQMGSASHPFYNASPVDGAVVFNDQLFHVPLLYDVFRDVLVVSHLSASGRGWFIHLEKELVDGFEMAGHYFRNYDRGFHEVLFEGKNLALVAKRNKISQLKNRIYNYIKNDRYFVIDDGDWRLITGKSRLIKLLNGKADQKELKKFMKQNRIKVRRHNDTDLVKVMEFINGKRIKT